jgi:hypothetical protein
MKKKKEQAFLLPKELAEFEKRKRELIIANKELVFKIPKKENEQN